MKNARLYAALFVIGFGMVLAGLIIWEMRDSLSLLAHVILYAAGGSFLLAVFLFARGKWFLQNQIKSVYELEQDRFSLEEEKLEMEREIHQVNLEMKRAEVEALRLSSRLLHAGATTIFALPDGSFEHLSLAEAKVAQLQLRGTLPRSEVTEMLGMGDDRSQMAPSTPKSLVWNMANGLPANFPSAYDCMDIVRYRALDAGMIPMVKRWNGEILVEELENVCHIGAGGVTGRGKSNWIRMALTYFLALRVHCVFVDPHFQPLAKQEDGRLLDWRPIGAALYRQEPFAIPVGKNGQSLVINHLLTEDEHILAFFQWLETELDHRIRRGHEEEECDYEELYVFVEELSKVIAEDKEKEISRIIGRLIKEARKFHIKLMVSTQGWLVKQIELDSSIIKGFQTNGYFGGDSYTLKALLNGDIPVKSVSDSLLHKGTIVYKSKQHGEPNYAQMGYASNEFVTHMLGAANTFKFQYPWFAGERGEYSGETTEFSGDFGDDLGYRSPRSETVPITSLRTTGVREPIRRMSQPLVIDMPRSQSWHPEADMKAEAMAEIVRMATHYWNNCGANSIRKLGFAMGWIADANDSVGYSSTRAFALKLEEQGYIKINRRPAD